MKDEAAPERLLALAEPGSVLGRGLRAAQDRGPSETELRALENRLAVALGAAAVGAVVGAGTTKGAAVTASAWLSAGAAKVTVAVVATALSVGGGVAWKRHATAAHQAAGDVALQRTPSRSHRIYDGVAVPRPVAPDPVVVESPPANAARDEERTPAPASAPAAASAAAPANAAAPASAAIRSPARPGTRASLRVAVTPVAERPARPMGSVGDSALADELNLIDRAQRALRDDPARALELAEEHARRFPNQVLEQEREVIEVTALMKLDRKAEAGERARRFVSRFPRSAHAVRMRAVAAAQLR